MTSVVCGTLQLVGSACLLWPPDEAASQTGLEFELCGHSGLVERDRRRAGGHSSCFSELRHLGALLWTVVSEPYFPYL